MADSRKKILIDPTSNKLSPDERNQMDAILFKGEEKTNYLGVSFSNQFFPRTQSRKELTQFKQTMFKRACKKSPANEHYELLTPNVVIAQNEETQIDVYEISGTYKKTAQGTVYKNRLAGNGNAGNKEKNKERVVKIYKAIDQNEINKIEKEYQLTQCISEIGMKPPTFFKIDEDTYFGCVVMDRLKGDDLYDLIKRDRKVNELTTDMRIDLSIALLEALDQVHQKKVVHRDLKPENIKVFYYEGKWQVNIFDFNLSKFAGDNDENEIYGSLAYISPEMVRKKGTTVQSDIHAMSLILGLLWQAQERDEASGEEKLLKKISKYQFPGLFREIDDLAGEHKKEIREGLMEMYDMDNPTKRLSIAGMIDIFKNVKACRQGEKVTKQLRHA